jgi:hypothetical protein
MKPATRKKIETKLLSTFNILDKTGKNSASYSTMFKSMSDKAFESFIKSLRDGDNLYLEILPFDNEPSLEDVKEAAESLNLPLEEYVYYRHITSEGKPIRTLKKVPVGYLHIKRLEQVLSKKNNYSFDIGSRNSLTNQVSGDSSVSRNSDTESYALTIMNADATLKELNGARADNTAAKNTLYQEIQMNGFSRLADHPNDPNSNYTLQTIDEYLLGAGMSSDLLTGSDVLLSEMNKNKI